MRKVLWSLAMIGCTLLATLSMLAWTPGEQPVEARIVQVKRGAVHQVVALSGRVAYADERLIFAQASGRVEQICTKAGERLEQNAALLRFADNTGGALYAAAVAAAAPIEHIDTSAISKELALSTTVIRAESACTVREVYVQEDGFVTMGMPVARVSSNQQEIVCTAVLADAEGITPGMWAWIAKDGEPLDFAEVHSVGEKTVDPITGMSCREIRLHPEQHIHFAEGEAVDVEVYIAGSDDVMTLPLEAITDRDTVWWVSDGRCTEIPAEIVMADEMVAWVSLPEGISVAIGEFTEGQLIAEAQE